MINANALHFFAPFLLIALIRMVYTGSGQTTFEIGTTINPIGSGARALGMANAFISVADDATAASWNPAGLMQLQHPEFSFAFEALSQSSQINSTIHPESEGHDTVDLQDFNYVSLLLPFYLGTNMVVSLNYLKLYRFEKSLNFPINLSAKNSDDFDARFFNFEFDQDGSFSVLTPALAIVINRRLSLGFSFNIWNDDITSSSHFDKTRTSNGMLSFGSSSGLFHRRIDEEFVVEEGYSFVVGGIYRFNEHWNLGMVIKPGFELDIDHKITEKNIQTGDFSENSPNDEIHESELEFPFIAGIGIAWRLNDALTLSSDITWTDWSKYVFRENNQLINPISGGLQSEGRLDDTFTIRTGCEYYLIRENYLIPLRFGLGYDPSPAVDSVDNLYTINCGTGIQIGSYNLDIGYEFRWGNNVNESLFQAIDATEDIRQHRVLASLIYYF